MTHKFCCKDFRSANAYNGIYRADKGIRNGAALKDDEGKYVSLVSCNDAKLVRNLVNNEEYFSDGLCLLYYKCCPFCGTKIEDYMS